MSQHTIRRCDECAAVLVEGSVSWCAWGEVDRPQFTTADCAGEFDPRHTRNDYCSHKCIITAFNRWLDTGSIVAPPTPPAYKEPEVEEKEDESAHFDPYFDVDNTQYGVQPAYISNAGPRP